jgi:dipeptidyl aminopeptidase/acylaminoacyl peptidase
MRTVCRIWCVVFALLMIVHSPTSAQSDLFRPPAIEATGVPPIPEALWQDLARYQDIRFAGFSGWSPRGDGILITTRFGDTTQLHRLYQPGGRREQTTFQPEPVRGTFVEHADDGAILFSMSIGGSEDDQVYCLLPREHRTVQLTRSESRNAFGPVSPDGQRVVISSNRRNQRDTDLYIAECRRGDSMEMLLETDGEYWFAADWSPDGARVLAIHYVSANESYLGIIDVATGELTRLPLPGQEQPSDEENGGRKVSVRPALFGPDGESIILASDLEGEFRQLAQFEPATGELQWLTKDIPWDVEDLDVDHESGRIAVAVNEDGASRVYLIEDGERRDVPLPLGIVGNLQFSPDGAHLGMTLSRPDAASDTYSVVLDSGKLTRWTYSEIGGLDPASFLVPERIKFRSFDSREIPAYYYCPKSATPEEPVPVFISIHGGPESQYRPYFSPEAQYYAGQLGVAVIAPNVRGSAGYGKTYLALDNAEKREDSVRDIGALLDWIAQQPELDEDRVLVAGGSYGGYMVLGSLTNFPDRIRAGIDRVGIANFITFLERTRAYRRDLRRAEYGDEREPEMRAYFERINPTANAGEIGSALLVVHGKNDPRVPFYEAQQIAERVRANNVPVWTVYAENEGHGFAKKDNRDYLRAVEAMFVQQFLLE